MFEGGGTAFWAETDESTADQPSLVVHPNVGVGVVFSGTVKHSGLRVAKGVRHVLVASFSIKDDEVSTALTPTPEAAA